jgi:alpha-glucosidase
VTPAANPTTQKNVKDPALPSIATTETRTETKNMADPTWWRQASVYQIYPRSFSDSNGDGIGDINGITAKVPYLKELGVDAVWLSPFYPSALADGGYDVDDYRNVDPRLGTLEDFNEMASALHAAGIKLIVDIVPNHSSDRHEWFREALASPKGTPARDRYIFRDGLGENGELPPSDWDSVFGGPAWERITEPDGTPGQWYMHIFAKEQPDFNWDNPEVRDDFLKTLRFWSDRGVDGFRIDVAHALTKNLEESLPTKADLEAQGEALYLAGAHPYWDRDEVHEIYAEWRKVFNEYNPPRTAVAEAWVHSDRRARYASPEGLGQAFNFDLLQADFDGAQFRKIITKNLAEAEASGASSTWVFSNHDVVRHATRYGLPVSGPSAEGGIMSGEAGKQWLLAGGRQEDVDVELGLRRARAASLLMFALPGSAYLYQGEELGLQEVGNEIPDSERQDPSFFRNKGVDIGRDGCRVPLPWTAAGSSFGFGTGVAHLPQPEWFASQSVEAQETQEDSTLSLYRRALALRSQLQTAEALEWLDTGRPDVVAFRRPNGWTSVTNFGTEAFTLPAGALLVSSSPLYAGSLPGATTAWLQV